MSNKAVILCGLLGVLFGQTVAAQRPLHSILGSGPFDRYGSSLLEMGDLNGDDAPEFAIGTTVGRVDVIDGSNGLVLFSLLGVANEDFGYAMARMGDVDGDNVPDLAVGAPSFSDASRAGRVVVFSGATQAILYTINGGAPGDRFGFSLTARDFTGDHIKELVIGAPGRDTPATDAGEVVLVNGVTGTIMLSYAGSQTGEVLGSSVATIRSLDADPIPELIVGAPGGNQPFVGSFFGGTGEVRVLSGASLTLLFVLQGESAEDSFGFAVTVTSDLDGDQLPEVVVGSPGSDEGPGADVGVVRVFSSSSRSLLRIFPGRESGERYGEIIANLGNLDGQGGWELAIGSPTYGEVLSGRVEVIDVATRKIVHEVMSTQVLHGIGKSIARSSGYGEDKFGEYYCGIAGTSPAGIFAGEVRCYTLGRGLYGAAPRGTVGLGVGGPFAILKVNGRSHENKGHLVPVKKGAPFHIAMRQVPFAPGPRDL